MLEFRTKINNDEVVKETFIDEQYLMWSCIKLGTRMTKYHGMLIVLIT